MPPQMHIAWEHRRSVQMKNDNKEAVATLRRLCSDDGHAPSEFSRLTVAFEEGCPPTVAGTARQACDTTHR